MKISQDQIDQIRDLTSIVDVVGDYVSLKRRGKNYFGLCPFHQEDTASFSVNEERKIFKCFGCGKGGSVFHFLQEYEKLTFPEAVQKLAERAGITLQIQDSATPEEKERITLLFEANEFAAQYYAKMLQSKQGESAQKYIYSRKFSPEILHEFQVGFAPDSWESFSNVARDKGFKEDVLIAAGLVGRNDKGQLFDRFRNRLMFPVRNIFDRIVGFGGRAMASDDPAKYLNTSETFLYQKSKLLFGLGQTKGIVREKNALILVEGYTDFLRLWENDLQHIAATSGTALTSYHAKVISRFTQNVYLLFDGDAAGITAAMRAGKILQFGGLIPKICLLPDGEDPDSFVQKNGKEALRQLLNSSEEFFQFFFHQHRKQIRTVDGKSQIIDELVEDLSHIQDRVRRELYVGIIAQKMGVSEAAIGSKINFRLRGKNKKKKETNFQHTIWEKYHIRTAGERAQFELLRIIIARLDGNIESEETILPDLFSHDLICEIIQRIDEENISSTNALLDAELSKLGRDLVSGLLMEKYQISNPDKLIRDCNRTLKMEKIDAKLDSLKSEILDAEKKGENVSQLFAMQIKLRNKKREIIKKQKGK